MASKNKKYKDNVVIEETYYIPVAHVKYPITERMYDIWCEKYIDNVDLEPHYISVYNFQNNKTIEDITNKLFSGNNIRLFNSFRDAENSLSEYFDKDDKGLIKASVLVLMRVDVGFIHYWEDAKL